MKRIFNLMAIAILLSVFCLASASAAMLPADIFPVDFRDNVWAAANGQTNYTVGNTTASAGSGQVLVTANLYQDMMDGLGIDRNCILGCLPGDEEDEIDDKEILTISFNIPMSLTGFWATNLFPYPDGNGSNPEQGRYSIDGGGWVTFNGIESDGNNYIAFGPPTMVQNIRFQVSPVPGVSLSDLVHGSRDNEYSIAGLTGVPEPGTYALMGVGLLGIAAIRRRKA